jgi:RimJ/RimL family protein N-acetyltransferase
MNFMDTKISTKNGTITIRPAQEADVTSSRDLRLEALRNHPVAFSADYAASKRHPSAYWKSRLHELGAEGMLYFAIHEGRLIGMCGVYRGDSPKTQHSAFIVSVYTQPEWRGLGIAEALIEACLVWGRAHGVHIAKLGVSTNNIAAIRCYMRCGFTVYGVEPSALYYEGVMYDELLMARSIDNRG